jgi:hypothetical protein
MLNAALTWMCHARAGCDAAGEAAGRTGRGGFPGLAGADAIGCGFDAMIASVDGVVCRWRVCVGGL